MIEGITIGIGAAFSGYNILMVMVGCFAGTIIGTLPGLGPMSAIALMIPITYGFDPASAMIMMAGVYYGAIFGGSTSSILINAPGVAGTVSSSFDGYPLAKSGQAGKALAIAAYSSFAGGTIAAIFLLIAAPQLAKVSLSFQSADYFALMCVGLLAIAAFASKGQFLKAMIMTALGLALATVGQDSLSDITRFAFGNINLMDGISFVLLVMATFAMSEAFMIIFKKKNISFKASDASTKKLGSIKLTKEEVKEIAPVIGRSSILGFFVGVLPGAGATIASFLAWGFERTIAPVKERLNFGKGSIKGLAAPETANNAACTGSFVPLLTLGIPGSGTTAVMLGALLSFGVQPGPRLYVEQPEIFWAVIISMYIGNIVLLVLNLPLIPYIARILAIPQKILVPLVLFFSVTGVYLISFNSFDIYFMAVVAIISLVLRVIDYPMPPLILGFILGGMLEKNLRRALIINDGSYSFLWERPISLTLFIIMILIILIQIYQGLKKRT
ncbi:tripartite tricarboxylate transporter permease [Alphaproteobacteria bacterium]|nr:tripartite tricarboxylate transporter permease [Alphaproteobacteria bacterium]MDB2635685.1 tripartite tricarboxylate transporter permease [Alphaproteobacteria bacterium]